jgi:predicted alternative tryptophan synthase beta-subunit
MNWTFHCLAFALCPKYYDPQYLATNAPGGIARKAPNQDKEVMVAVLEAFEKISEDADEQNLLRSQLNTFVMKKGLFGLPQVQLDAVTMNPIDWWFNYGAETPELAEVAK